MCPSHEQLAYFLNRGFRRNEQEEEQEVFVPTKQALKSPEEIAKFRRMNPGSTWADDEEISRRIA